MLIFLDKRRDDVVIILIIGITVAYARRAFELINIVSLSYVLIYKIILDAQKKLITSLNTSMLAKSAIIAFLEITLSMTSFIISMAAQSCSSEFEQLFLLLRYVATFSH